MKLQRATEPRIVACTLIIIEDCDMYGTSPVSLRWWMQGVMQAGKYDADTHVACRAAVRVLLACISQPLWRAAFVQEILGKRICTWQLVGCHASCPAPGRLCHRDCQARSARCEGICSSAALYCPRDRHGCATCALSSIARTGMAARPVRSPQLLGWRAGHREIN